MAPITYRAISEFQIIFSINGEKDFITFCKKTLDFVKVIGNDPTCSSAGYSWTTWFDRDNPSGDEDNETKDNDICNSPTALEVSVKNIKKYIVGFKMFLRRNAKKKTQSFQKFLFFVFTFWSKKEF